MTETADIDALPPSAWQPTQDKVDLGILGKTQEEVHELGKVIARIIIQGIDEADPSSGKINRAALADELDDVAAMTRVLRERYGLAPDLDRQVKKYNYHLQWHRMLREQP